MPGMPAAKMGDKVVGLCTHIIMNPSPGGPVPTPTPHPFMGIINGNLSPTVKIMGQAAATLGSTAANTPAHIPIGAGPFQIPPRNQATITVCSSTVMINNKPAARTGDSAMLCSDIPMLGNVIAVGTVMVG